MRNFLHSCMKASNKWTRLTRASVNLHGVGGRAKLKLEAKGARHRAQGKEILENREGHQKWRAQNGIIGPTTDHRPSNKLIEADQESVGMLSRPIMLDV